MRVPAREAALAGLLAATALAFVSGLLSLLLGARVPPGVALSVYAAEAALGTLVFAPALLALGALPGTGHWLARPRRLHAAALGLAAGVSGWLWLYDMGKVDDLATALGPSLGWFAWVAAGAAAAGWLADRPPSPPVGRAGLIARHQLALLPALATMAWLQRADLDGIGPASRIRPAIFAAIAALAAAIALGWPASAPAGRVRRRWPAHPLIHLVVLAAAAAWASATTARAPEPAVADPVPGAADPATRPNVVLVSIDTLRADHLGCYGYRRDTSPALDRLAAEGVRFQQAISTAPWTLPAHATLLTSRYAGELEGYRPAGTPSLATVLRQAGYRTWALTGGYLLERERFGDGFELYQDDGEDAYVMGTSPVFLRLALIARQALRHRGVRAALLNPLNGWRLGRTGFGGEVGSFAGVDGPAASACRWIEQHGRSGPFLLFFHTYVVHEYFRATLPLQQQADRWLPAYDGFLRGNNLDYGQRLPRGDDLEYLVALYDGAIRSADAAVGQVLATLERTGLAADTLVVVTSDHGEGLRPDLGRTWHRRRLHDDLLHVPLLLRLPGRLPAGLTIARQASLVDVLPTVLELVHIQPPPGIRGRSLLPLVTGASAPLRAEAFAETADPALERQGAALRTEAVKYIHTHDGGKEVYDLAADPAEIHNLIGSIEDPALAVLARGIGRFLSLGRLDDPEPDGDAREPDEDALEVMRSLGYVD